MNTILTFTYFLFLEQIFDPMCSNLGFFLLETADANHLNLMVGPHMMLGTRLQLKLNWVRNALSYICIPPPPIHFYGVVN